MNSSFIADGWTVGGPSPVFILGSLTPSQLRLLGSAGFCHRLLTQWNLRFELHWRETGDFREKRKTRSRTLSPPTIFSSAFSSLLQNEPPIPLNVSSCWGDSFYSYTGPDSIRSLPVLKLSSKRFPLPVQSWISFQECTSSDSHFLLDMTELPFLRQPI